MSDWRHDEARNQIRARNLNEQTRASHDRLGMPRPSDRYRCECGDPSCREPIELTPQEYESVRGDGTWFAIALNHENPELDHVVTEHQRFATVKKVGEEFYRMARARNPRAG